MSEFSQISHQQEVYFLIDTFGIGAFALILSIAIYLRIKYTELHSKDSNDPKFYQWGVKCALISVSFGIIIFLLKMLFINDLIIPWDFENDDFGTINDSLYFSAFIIQKLMLLYSFSFHMQSLSSKNYLANLAIFWLVLSAVICFVTGGLIIILDALMMSTKEIGITESSNIYILMYLGFESDNNGNEKFDDLSLAIFISGIVYMVLVVSYYLLLLWHYMYGLKPIEGDINFIVDNRMQRVKGAVIILVSLIVYSLDTVEFTLQSDLGYLLDNMVIMVDTICLFLLFKSGQIYYEKSCGLLCDSCCKKLMFRSNNDGQGDMVPLPTDVDV